MGNSNIIIGLKEEVDLLKDKLFISQSLVKIGFWEYNRTDKLIYLSDEALEILHLNANKSVFLLDEFAAIIDESPRQTFYDKINESAKKIEDFDFELELKTNNHENEKWIKVISNNASYSKKKPDIIIGIVQDISEQKRNEKLLKLAKDRAEEADFLKSAFLANMSHEIRTPLNAILGFSKLLTNPEIPNNQRNEYSEYITSSANNLLNLIRDIIDVSKIEAGKMIIERKDCEINKVLKELKFTFEREKETQLKDHIEIKLKEGISDKDFSIITDPFRFHQIMVNLIGNALKFIEKGYIEFGYSLVETRHGASLQTVIQFYVKDTGIGIPDDKVDFIFSRFGQIIDNKIKNPGGTGLGLSITKHLIERLGGKIWVESKPGKGTTFSFTLPYILSEKSNFKNLKFDKELDELELEDIKVLAVEDDQINMILLEDVLALHTKNMSFVKAFNGFEAIEKLKEANFDLIIMDIRMPLMDGYEATSRIRHEFEYPKNLTPILGLSAHALKEEIEKGKQLGMTDFLSKPIVPSELILKIKKLLFGINNQFSASGSKVSCVEKGTEKQILDLSFLEKIYKNNNEKLKRTLKVYLQQIPEQLSQIKETIETSNIDKLHNISHSLKSTFKYLGRIDLSEYAREIEFQTDPINNKEIIIEKINLIQNEWVIIEENINHIYFS